MIVMSYDECYIRFIITEPEGKVIISLILLHFKMFGHTIYKYRINLRKCITNRGERIIVMSCSKALK